MDVCPACNASFSQPTVTGLCPECDAAEGMPAAKTTLAITALVVGAIPFFLSISNRQTTTMSQNGEVVAENVTGMDYVALGAGGLAAAIGIAALIPAIKKKNGSAIGLAVAAIGLGIYQVARGLFLV